MLSIYGDGAKYCDGLTRRSFLKIGGLAMGGSPDGRNIWSITPKHCRKWCSQTLSATARFAERGDTGVSPSRRRGRR